MKHKDIPENEAQQPVDETKTETANNNGNNGQQTEAKTAEPSETEQLKLQVEELKDKYLRQAAEFDNFRRRSAKERIELVQTAGKEVITDLLDVLDDMDRAQKQIDATGEIDQIKEGVQLVFNKLRQTLQSKGLKPMETKGKDFDVDQHEAITEIEAGDEWKGKVVDEVQRGYFLNDKIIRYAKVVVGK